MKHKTDTIVKYVGNDYAGPKRNSLCLVTDSIEGRVQIQSINKDGSRSTLGTCDNEDVVPATDDGRVAIYLAREAKLKANYTKWAERFTNLLARIEVRHKLAIGQAAVIAAEVEAARSYLEEPPRELWRPDES